MSAPFILPIPAFMLGPTRPAVGTFPYRGHGTLAAVDANNARMSNCPVCNGFVRRSPEIHCDTCQDTGVHPEYLPTEYRAKVFGALDRLKNVT